MARGVKKVNEKIVEEGRALIITDRLVADWEDIPYGSLHIDPVTGVFYVKLIGHSDWVKVEFGTANPDPGPGDGGWEGELPYAPLTPEQVEEMIRSMRKRIQDTEIGTGGLISNWPSQGNQTAEVKLLRRKVIDLYESANKSLSTFFVSLQAKNMSEAFNIISTGVEAYIEGITGLSNDVNTVRIQVNELLEIIYPGKYIANEIVDAYEIARQLRVVYESIGEVQPNWIKESGLLGLSAREVLQKCSDSIVLIKDTYHTTVAIRELEKEVNTLLTFVPED